MNLIEMSNISKRFGEVIALDNVDFTIKRGEIHVLLGENGAGKSTLMKILFGYHNPSAGQITIDGFPVIFKSSLDAIKHGIGMVNQHFMLVPVLSVMDNIIAGFEPKTRCFIDYKKAKESIETLARNNGFNIDPQAKIEALSVGEQQRVEILKVLYKGAKVLIFDEPTAVLTPLEVEDLFVTLRRLRDEGHSIVLITHKLNEIKPIADRVTVLRDGKLIGTVDKTEINIPKLVQMMVGRDVKLDLIRRAKSFGKNLVQIKDLNYSKDNKKILSDINIDIREGEIYGIAGVEGNGQSELLEVLIGLIKPDRMTLTVNGKVLKGSTKEKIHHGVGIIPEDRIKQGLALGMTVSENIILGYEAQKEFCQNGFLKLEQIRQTSNNLVREFKIKTASINSAVASLSGGNQQKILIARVFSRNPDFIICAQPTRGIDVSATEFIHELMLDYRDQGKAILLISADLDEVKKISDTIGVMFEGKIVEEDSADNFDDHRLGKLMTGVSVVSTV